MKNLITSLGCVFTLLGCSFHQYQNDLADNQYDKKEIHSDSLAAYIGAWTTDEYKWRKIVKVKDDGRVKVVLYPEFGAIEGKIYLEDGKTFFILKDGTKSAILNASKDYLQIESYGKQEKLATSIDSKRFN